MSFFKKKTPFLELLETPEVHWPKIEASHEINVFISVFR